MPMLDQCMKTAGLSPRDLDGIACTSGPGSFTGIRIGVSTAKGLAHAIGLSIIAVPTLDALAYNIFDITSLIIPVMDARRGQVYTASYRIDNNSQQMTRLNDYACIPLSDILLDLEKIGQRAVFTGDGVSPLHNSRDILSKGHAIASANMHQVRASSVGLLALDKICGGYKPLHYSALTPLYLRKPQAERDLEARSSLSYK